jgi:carboxyl-terminal processing protease
VIVSTKGLHYPEKRYDATGSAYTNTPLYLLTDGESASASEIVAGAIKDDKRGTLVGATTYGKGLVQNIEPLSNGGALKVTTALYYTPSGKNINKVGIAPDVTAPDDPKTPDVDECVEATLALIGRTTASK